MTKDEALTGPALARSKAIAKYISLIRASFWHKKTCSQHSFDKLVKSLPCICERFLKQQNLLQILQGSSSHFQSNFIISLQVFLCPQQGQVDYQIEILHAPRRIFKSPTTNNFQNRNKLHDNTLLTGFPSAPVCLVTNICPSIFPARITHKDALSSPCLLSRVFETSWFASPRENIDNPAPQE